MENKIPSNENENQLTLSTDKPQGNVDASEFLTKLISNTHVPEPIALKFWALFSLSSKLTFLSERDVHRKMIEFEIMRLTFIKSIPKKNYTPEVKIMLSNVQMEFNYNLKRSAGNGRMNERELEASSTSAVFAERPLTENNAQNRGIVSSFFGLFGGGKR